MDEDHFLLDTMSPPPSASEPDNQPPFPVAATAVTQQFAARGFPYEYHDEEMDGEQEMDEDLHRHGGHTETVAHPS